MAEATNTPTTAKTTTTTKTSTPRTPRARKTAPAKAAPAAAKPAEVTPGEIRIVMDYVGDTARYAKFQFPAELGGAVVGNVYAPLGTTTVKVLVQGVEPGTGKATA